MLTPPILAESTLFSAGGFLRRHFFHCDQSLFWKDVEALSQGNEVRASTVPGSYGYSSTLGARTNKESWDVANESATGATNLAERGMELS
jgi:hypothetical protein